jgi:myo-inositol-1(or 4)-monophosphatase
MNLNECLDAAKQASLLAGKKLKENFFKPQELLANSGRDIKLAIDQLIESDIKHQLKSFGYGFLGEETGFDKNNDSKYFWVVDPLDGTSNYYRNIPICANAIALMDNNLNVYLAVVNSFLEEKLYFASLDNGSYCNDNSLSVSEVSNKSEATLMTGIPAKTNYTDLEFKDMIQSFQDWKKIRMIGSAAIAGAWVAEGIADCYQEKGIFIWDIAATMLLVQEAGGKASITDPDKEMRVNAEFSNGQFAK